MAGAIWTLLVCAGLFILLEGIGGIKPPRPAQERILGSVSSNLWLALIVVGAVLAALGNVGFNVARDREKGERASAKAMRMLHSEMERNLGRLLSLRQNLKTGQVATASLETTAWTVVSTSGLLAQMDQETLGEVADAYHLLGQAEAYRSEIVNRSTGITQALGGSGAVTQQYIGYLLVTLEQLEPKLHVLLAKPLT
ncbi:hypothetical protein [Bradyrhizobium diazoefficiens]